jgi:hypothetical protein
MKAHSVDQSTRNVIDRFYAFQASTDPDERAFAEFLDDQIKLSLMPWRIARVDNAYLEASPLG